MHPFLFLTAALLLNAFANVLIKYSMSRAVPPLLPVQGTALAAAAPFLSWSYLLGLLCFGLNLVCYSLALRNMKISVAYPLMVSLGYLVILAFGWFLFAERLTAVQYVGIGIVFLGFWLVVR
jgi:multidrug transporter EmrE-like cation transporter